MYRYIDLIRIIAVGLAAAVIMSLTERKADEGGALKECILFPQFAAAAAADKGEPTDGEEIVFSFKIAELINEIMK